MVASFLTAGALLVLSSLYMLIPLLPALSQAFHAPLPQTAYVNTAFSLFYACGFLAVGAIAPRCGSKKTIVVGLGLLAAVTFAAAFARSLEALIALRALEGLVAATFPPTALTYITDNYPPDGRIAVMSWVTTGFISAGVIGQVISSFLERSWGWPGVFAIMGGGYLVLAFLGAGVLAADAPSAPGQIAGPFAARGRLIANRPLLRAYAVAVTLLLTFVALYSALDSHLTAVFAMNRQDIFQMRAGGILGMVGSLCVPPLAARLTLSRLVALGLAIMLASLFLAAATTSPVFFQASLVLFVAGLLITIPSIISLVAQLAGTDRGPAITWYSFILFAGAGVGPLIANSGNFAAVIAVLIALLATALATALTIKPPAST